MFDFGFWELVLVFIVALLVIGPERLPGVARKAGLWVGRARRFVSSVRSDIERELRAEELREMLNKQQSEIEQLRGMLEETQAEVRDELQETDTLVQAIEEQIERGTGSPQPPQRDVAAHPEPAQRSGESGAARPTAPDASSAADRRAAHAVTADDDGRSAERT